MQYFRISRLETKVDVVVTDSPILLSSFYNHDLKIKEELDALVTKIFHSYQSMNVFINRATPYSRMGRYETEEESDALSEKMLKFLAVHNVYCKPYPGCAEGYDMIFSDVLNQLETSGRAFSASWPCPR